MVCNEVRDVVVLGGGGGGCGEERWEGEEVVRVGGMVGDEGENFGDEVLLDVCFL